MAWSDYQQPASSKKLPEKISETAARWKKAAANPSNKKLDTAEQQEERTPCPEFKIPENVEQELNQRTNNFTAHLEEEQFKDKSISLYTREQRHDFEYIVMKELARIDVRPTDFPIPKDKKKNSFER